MKQLITASLLLLMTIVPADGADEIARVRTAVDTNSPVWVGQAVSIHVDLMSSTLFSGAPVFELPVVARAFVMKTEGRPVLNTEQVDGESWSIQRHDFRIYPHQPGKFTVPSFPVRFSVAPAFGKPPEEQRLVSETVTFEARLPPGAEGLSLLISTPELQVEEVWTPPVSDDRVFDLKVGDAITREITVKARDVPGMALPAITFPEPVGTSAYPKQPSVQDQTNRGDLTGERVDSVTFVCERPGKLVLPALVIPWWNTDANEMQRVTLPSVTANVAPSVTMVEEKDDVAAAYQTTSPSKSLVIGMLCMSALAVLIWRYRIAIRTRLTAWKTRRDDSESAYFARLRQACHADDPVTALNAIMRWLDKRSSGTNVATLDAFLASHDDASLKDELTGLQRAALDHSKTWSGDRLLAALRSVRDRRHTLRPIDLGTELPSLNPFATDVPPAVGDGLIEAPASRLTIYKPHQNAQSDP